MTQFFTAFCTGCILLGLLYIICPEGNISKPIKYTFSLVFLCLVISAANIPFKNISLESIAPANSQQDSSEMQIAAAEYVFAYTLKEQNINFSDISIFTNKSQGDSIVISKVVIVSDEPRENIIKALGELAQNREVEIVNE